MARAILLFLPLSIILAACTVAAPDDGESVDSLVAVGCPTHPTCDSKSNTGAFCLPTCDPACLSKRTHFGFWVTPYEVQGSYDWGRHQGIAIIGAEVSFDTRFSITTPKVAAKFGWTRGDLGDLPPDVEDAIVGTKTDNDKTTTLVPEDYAMCAAPQLLLDQPLGNHGRAMARDAKYAASRVELAPLDVDTSPGDDATRTTRIAQCVHDIPSGYCDVVCGNCSYVLPSATIATTRASDWSKPEALVSGPGTCDGDESTYGRPGAKSVPTITGSELQNEFTHCAFLGCKNGEHGGASFEAPSIKAWISSQDMVLSGLYGHNSNTDAEAAFTAYQACAHETGAPRSAACSKCGQDQPVQRQRPCQDETNTATAYWTATASHHLGGAFTDLVPPIRDQSAGARPEPPVCSWGGFPVHGM